MEKGVSGVFVVLVCIIAFAASVVSAGSGKISVVYSWEKNQQRNSTVSPELKLEGVTAETKKFKISLSDQDKPMNDHGQGSIPYDGPGGSVTIPKGAVKGLRGPDPPGGQRHLYIMKVDCLDKDGRVLATGEGISPCCN